MSIEAVAYPFLFIAIFFETFVLVTFLSAPARRRRAGLPALGSNVPEVAIIVPCYNEERTIAATVRSLLALDYPKDKLRVVLVDNNSTDHTRARMEEFLREPRVTILSEKTQGKHYAMNAGIRATEAEIIGCLDADSFVAPDALRHAIPCFDMGVGAVTAAMSVHEPKNPLQYMQYAEYLFGIAWRHTLASVNGLYVTPGPFSLYRREVVVALGGFRYGHQVEDLELALRLQKNGYLIENAPRARVYTRAPRTLFALIKQRTRWTSGFLRNVLFEYRDLVFSRAHAALGMFVLPLAILSIGSGILLFVTLMSSALTRVYSAISMRAGIPLSYAYVPTLPSLDWFFVPLGFFVILGAVLLTATLSLIVIGKHISRTPGRLTEGLIAYLTLYGLIAPLWLMRAAFDVALGKQRAWR